MTPADPLPRRVALCDANNFFVSCERLFRPDLAGRPVVVLSANDGCVVSRSDEAKALGIPMGIPHFEIRGLCVHHGVTVFSSNFELYRDVSARMMALLGDYTDRLEVYSVDEAFLSLEIAALKDPEAAMRGLRGRILQELHLPVSVGLAPTKTLAKAAARRAKLRREDRGVFDLAVLSPEERDRLLEDLEAEEVWGVGRRLGALLRRRGIRTARQLRDASDLWVLRHLTVRGLNTVWELRGIPCLPLKQREDPAKTLQVSRSFGRDTSRREDLEAALASFAATAGERLREQGLLAGQVRVHAASSPHRGPYRVRWAEVPLPRPTAYTPDLIAAAREGLGRLFVPGILYAKAGILLTHLSSQGAVQRDLFDETRGADARKRRLMEAVDRINDELGGGTLVPALLRHPDRPWAPRSALRSSPGTTRLEALPRLHLEGCPEGF